MARKGGGAAAVRGTRLRPYLADLPIHARS